MQISAEAELVGVDHMMLRIIWSSPRKEKNSKLPTGEN